jgi:PAS domain S-box-containing protein
MISKRSAARHSFYPLSKIKPGSERRAAKIKRLPAYSLQNVEEMVTTETGAVEAEIKNDPITEIDHYYRQILDNLPVAVYTCDTKGFITQYNKAAAALTGWEPLPGKDTWQRLLPDLAEGISATSDTYSIENTLNEGWTARKSKIERNDGTFVHVTVQLSPITDTEYHLIGAAFTLVREAVPDTVYHFFKKPEQKQDTQQQAEELELIRERAEELSKINEQLEIKSPAGTFRLYGQPRPARALAKDPDLPGIEQIELRRCSGFRKVFCESTHLCTSHVAPGK